MNKEGYIRSVDKIAEIQNLDDFEIEAEMFASCVKEELILGAIPITYRARLGEAKLGSVVDGWAIFKKLLIRRIFGDPIEVVTGKGNLDMN